MKHIIVDPDICNGKPVLQGTRIPVQTILEFLSAGDSTDDVLEEYPTLTREDILQCLAKVPIVRIDKALEKYKDKSLFQAKVDNANEVLRTVGLPKQNTQEKTGSENAILK